MDEAQARREIERRLVFGDEKQIAAVKFLAALRDAWEAWIKCRHRKNGEWNCDCAKRFPDDVVAAIDRKVRFGILKK